MVQSKSKYEQPRVGNLLRGAKPRRHAFNGKVAGGLGCNFHTMTETSHAEAPRAWQFEKKVVGLT